MNTIALRRYASVAAAVSLTAPSAHASGPYYAPNATVMQLRLPGDAEPREVTDFDLLWNPVLNRFSFSALTRVENGETIQAPVQGSIGFTPVDLGDDGTIVSFELGDAIAIGEFGEFDFVTQEGAVVNKTSGEVVATLSGFGSEGAILRAIGSNADAGESREESLLGDGSAFRFLPVPVRTPSEGPNADAVAIAALEDPDDPPTADLIKALFSLDPGLQSFKTLTPDLDTSGGVPRPAGDASTDSSYFGAIDIDGVIGVSLDAGHENPQTVRLIDREADQFVPFDGLDIAATWGSRFAFTVIGDDLTDAEGPVAVVGTLDTSNGYTTTMIPIVGSESGFLRETSLAVAPDKAFSAFVANTDVDGPVVSLLDMDGAPRTSLIALPMPEGVAGLNSVDVAISDDRGVFVSGLTFDGDVVMINLGKFNGKALTQNNLLHGESFLTPYLSPSAETFVTGDNTAEITRDTADPNNYQLTLLSLDGSAVTYETTLQTVAPASFDVIDDPALLAAARFVLQGNLGVTVSADDGFIEGDAKIEVEWFLQSTIDPGMTFSQTLTLTSEDFRDAAVRAGDEVTEVVDFSEVIEGDLLAQITALIEGGIAESTYRVTLSAAADPLVAIDDLFVTLDIVPEPASAAALLAGLGLAGRRRRAAA